MRFISEPKCVYFEYITPKEKNSTPLRRRPNALSRGVPRKVSKNIEKKSTQSTIEVLEKLLNDMVKILLDS